MPRPKWTRLDAVLLTLLVASAGSAAGLAAYAVSQSGGPPGHGPIGTSYVPYIGTDTDSEAFASALSATTTHSVNTSAGDFIAVFVLWNTSSTPTSVSTISDSLGNTLVHSATSNEGTVYEESYYTQNCPVGAHLITVTFTASVAFDVLSAVVHHVNATALDLSIPAKKTHGATSIAPVTTVVADDLLVGAVVVGAAKTVAGTSSTSVLNTTSTATLSPALVRNSTTTAGVNYLSTSWTGTAYAQTIGFAIMPSTALTAPTALTVSTFNKVSITYTWTNQVPTAGGGEHVNSTLYYAVGTSCSGAMTAVNLGGVVATYDLTGLTSGVEYATAVTEWNASAQSAQSSCVLQTTAQVPPAPTSLAIGAVTTTTIALTWTQSTGGGIVNNTVEDFAAAACGGGALSKLSTSGAATGYTVTGLTTATEYSFKVESWNATGASVLSSCVAATTAQVPAAPTSLTVASVTTTTASLTWTNPASAGKLNSTVYYAVGTSCAGTLSAVNIGSVATSDTVTGLAAGTEYAFAVTVWNVTGQSPQSNCVLKTTAQVPAAPTAFALTGSTGTTMTFSWTLPPGGGLVNVTFYYKAGSVCTGALTAISLASTPAGYVVTGLVHNTEYCATITAWNATGQSPSATPATGYTTPAAPTALTATTVSDVRINLAWTNPAGTLSDNHVYVFAGAACGGSPTGHDLGSVVTGYGVTGLTPATAYSFEVTATGAGGEGTDSACVANTTYDPIPAAPTNLKAATVSATEIDLTWTNPAGTLTDNHVYVWDSSCSVPVTSYDLGSAMTSYHDTALSGATAYAFDVTASTISGEGSPSLCPQNTTLPAAASGLTGSALTDASVHLAWTNPSGTLTGTEAYAYPTVGCTGSPSADATGITANGAVTFAYSNSLSHHTTYYFDVVPSSAGGPAAAASNCFAITTDYAPPNAPAMEWANTTGTTSINVSWLAAGPGVVINYTVEYGFYGGAIGNLTSAGTVLYLIVTGLAPSTEYTFKVAAWTNGGESPFGSAVSNTTYGSGPVIPNQGQQAGFIIGVLFAVLVAYLLIYATWTAWKWRRP